MKLNEISTASPAAELAGAQEVNQTKLEQSVTTLFGLTSIVKK